MAGTVVFIHAPADNNTNTEILLSSETIETCKKFLGWFQIFLAVISKWKWKITSEMRNQLNKRSGWDNSRLMREQQVWVEPLMSNDEMKSEWVWYIAITISSGCVSFMMS